MRAKLGLGFFVAAPKPKQGCSSKSGKITVAIQKQYATPCPQFNKMLRYK
ncbi:hypothetical protein PCIT_b1265 [Pseudoalteromonas citrea]|uniref:Uncharacterized protein n=1 Tax=Pseudoalteromonas citrea TaxID=43655 RepID=A0AAD4AFR4_9GAMM|nr:hypothetical protein PCIT_b1265 [Pseudoalteromonas citrea]